MATPYSQTMSPVMVRYTKEVMSVYVIMATPYCHGKIYKGVYMYM